MLTGAQLVDSRAGTCSPTAWHQHPCAELLPLLLLHRRHFASWKVENSWDLRTPVWMAQHSVLGVLGTWVWRGCRRKEQQNQASQTHCLWRPWGLRSQGLERPAFRAQALLLNHEEFNLKMDSVLWCDSQIHSAFQFLKSETLWNDKHRHPERVRDSLEGYWEHVMPWCQAHGTVHVRQRAGIILLVPILCGSALVQ